MERNTKSEIRLSKSNGHYKLPLNDDKNQTNNIFLSLPYLNNIKNNRNDGYKSFNYFNSTSNINIKSCFQDKTKTILIDKKISKNFFNDISNKNIPKSNRLINTQYTGFFVIPTAEKSVSIERVSIPITAKKFSNSKKSLKKNSNSDKFLINKKFRFANNKYSSQKKLPVGEVFKSKGIKFFKNKKVKNDFEVGGKFRYEEKDSKYIERNLFNEKVKIMIEEEKNKKFRKKRGPMNCREVLEFIKNDKCSKTNKLIKKTIEDKYRTKNNLHLFFKDFQKYCDEFNNWNDNDNIYIK